MRNVNFSVKEIDANKAGSIEFILTFRKKMQTKLVQLNLYLILEKK